MKHFIVEQNFLAQIFVALANRSTRQLLDRRKGGEIRSGRLPRDELNTKSYVCSGPETPEMMRVRGAAIKCATDV